MSVATPASQCKGSELSALELWAGMECTQNRVADSYFDQLDRTGHAFRLSDLDLFAKLGVSAIRQPVLWERVSPDDCSSFRWDWSDERLSKLRELGIRPILGLLHHGSGPAYTSLIDPEFPDKFSRYSRAVAERYPWVTDFTPVNEPLTTARFSGLYGHWYPHGKSDQSFVRCLLNQCRATVLAMTAIREVIPQARLIQTEDLGFTHTSPLLRYQGDFENLRRWLSLDLLCGRVNHDHPLWRYLTDRGGATERELLEFVAQPCPPDVLGFNYYLTSERFLHEKLFLYPRHLHGGNGRHCYVDIEAARVRTEGVRGAAELLLDAWKRYRLPLAITECHNGSSREEQIRWVGDVWSGCKDAQNRGADVRAFTLWASFGCFDWDSLVTTNRGHYEPGVFDVRSPQPRPTAIVRTAANLRRGEPLHPLLEVKGWWARRDRLAHAFSVLESGTAIPSFARHASASSGFHAATPLCITGSTGTLGRAFARLCELRAIPYRALSRKDLNIADPDAVAKVLGQLRPWAVINAAGYVRVDEAESEIEACKRANTVGPTVLAQACGDLGIQFVTFSSDLVFDGVKAGPYVESDPVAPVNVYGVSKALAERDVLRTLPSALVIRTSAFFGPWDEHSFITAALRKLSIGETFVAREDCTVSPTYVPDLVNNALDLLIDGESGIWHLVNKGAITWFDLAATAAQQFGIPTDHLVSGRASDFPGTPHMPANSALASEKAWIMPTLEDALRRYPNDCELSFRRLAQALCA